GPALVAGPVSAPGGPTPAAPRSPVRSPHGPPAAGPVSASGGPTPAAPRSPVRSPHGPPAAGPVSASGGPTPAAPRSPVRSPHGPSAAGPVSAVGRYRQARSLPSQIAVHHLGLQPVVGQPPGQLLGHRHRAVFAPGAAHGERQVPLALPQVA